MSPEVNSAAPAEPVAYDHFRQRANWGERVVTAVAVSMAVLVVAIIAVLMGMA